MFAAVVVGVGGIRSGRATGVRRKLTMPLGCVPVLLRPEAQIKYAMRRRVARPYIIDCVCVFISSYSLGEQGNRDQCEDTAVVGVGLTQ